MLGEGDALWLAATYADGALGYLGFDPTVTGGETERVVADAFIVGTSLKVDGCYENPVDVKRVKRLIQGGSGGERPS